MDPENEKLCNNMLDSSIASNLDNNNLIKSDCLKRTLDDLVCHQHDPKSLQKHHNEEKNDISPENSNKKSNDTSPLSEFDKLTMTDSGFGSSKMNKSFSLQTIKNNPVPPPPPTDEDINSELNRGMAFTIDFNSGKQIDEQRHKSMLERFQKNRHRRGVSMSSQAEDEMCDSSSSSQLTSKLKAPPSARLSRKKSIGPSMSGESSLEIVNKPATVRLRDKSKTNQLKDSSKRHSWSPRSSMASPTLMPPPPQPHQQATMKSTRTSNRLIANALENPLKLHKLTAADMKSNMGAMFATSQPPLENKSSHFNDDSVSEAGTYTLDGDNYTEEQKEKMNIDKLTYEAAAAAAKNEELLMLRRLEINENDSNIETDLEIIDLELIPSNNNMQRQTRLNRNEVSSMEVRNSRNNILEVSLCYEPPSNASKQKVSYLEKLKTRMKNIGEKKFHKSKSPDPDVGCFTSVTTSGVLSLKPTLELHPRLKRKNSLTKSQIDSSEYVQGCHRMAATEKNSITDNDKTQMQIAAGYQLNIFSQQQPQPSPKGRKESCASSNTSISTAATKDDWIQEWAKNAREFSRQKRQPTAPTSTIMSQSYNFENVRDKNNQFGDFGDDANVMSRSDSRPQFDEFGDNLEKYYQQKQQQQKSHDNCNEQSLTLQQQHPRQTNNLSQHESISSYRGRRILRDFDFNKDESLMNIKPPISPSRIPSPIGSLTNRTRRCSQSRGMYGSETDLTNDTELYLQRTAAAITTLQNLHRRNSLRNSSLQNSPNSPLSPTRPPPAPIVQSSKVTTTTGNRGNVAGPRTSVHKRNASLDGGRFASTVMSSSLQSHAFQQQMNDSRNKQQQQQQHQQHSRHNSYDGMPPKSGTTKYSNHHHQFDQTTTDDDDYESFMLPEHNQLLIKQLKQQQQHQQQQQQQQSPIKRSSSFNTKAAQDVPSPRRPSGTPKMQPKYTGKPVSAPTSAAHNRIQKSASAASFRKMLNDDDEFYINDDDDLNANQFSGSDFSDDDKKYEEPPISNTRFNKTFLMRREQAKNKAAGKQPMACPNTPEMPRRDTNVRASFRDRASMPRDSSLNRLQKEMKPLSANSSLTSPNAQKNRGVTPKYLDISKYKPERGNNFLKRDESKSYLQKNEVKKSSSSICIQNAVNFQRVDVGRASSRSSTGAGGGSSSRPTSAGNKKKEVKTAAELAAWKRRTSYDPLKAANEGKKKAEEAKRLAQQQLMMSSEGSSVLRSQSYHGEQDNMSSSRWIDESSSDLDDEIN